MNEKDEALEELLQRAASGPADCELKRDLWPVYGEFIRSRSDRSFVQSSTMGPPTVRVEA